MNTYHAWAAKYPEAAAALDSLIGASPLPDAAAGASEARVQQEIRLEVAHQGAASWRNNVGATPAKTPVTCPKCRFQHRIEQTPVRYGLANDSTKMNQRIKSSDLILAVPRLITPAHVGTTIAQFGAIECKRPGWSFKGTDREIAQRAWLQLIVKLGGFATFATGPVEL